MKKAYIIRIAIVTIIGILTIPEIFGLIYPQIIANCQLMNIYHELFSNFSFAVLFLFLGILLITYIFGRIYCSTICPLGILQEAVDILHKKLSKKKKKNAQQKNYKYKYILAAICFILLTFNCTVLENFTNPYIIFANAISFKLTGLILVFLIIILVFFKNRFFCTNICPLGAILGLISKYSIFKIKFNKTNCVACGVCARSCPSGCIDIQKENIDNEMCINCFKCVRVCPQNTITYDKNNKR